jgi:hypothetical protein
VTRESSDARDYRVMLARAVYAERAWRIHGHDMRPAEFVAGELEGRDYARELEEANGEPLA